MATISPMQSVDVERPLGTLEHFLSLVDQHRSAHFAVTAHIEGRTTIPAWRSALDAVQKRHPLFSVRIEFGEDGAPHFRIAANFPIRLRIAENPSRSRWKAELAKELATPFRAQEAPLVRAVLVHGTTECFLILTAHHSIADGLSLNYAVRDILHALSEEDLEPLPPLPSQESLLKMSQDASDEDHRPVQSGTPQNGTPVAFRALDDSLPSIEALSLDPELTSKLIEISRKERTTVHGALCSALVLSAREVSDWSNNSIRIMSPFNLRRQLGIAEDCGLFVWAGIIPVEPTLTDFWDMARFAKSALTRTQSLESVSFQMAGLNEALAAGIDVHGASQFQAQAFPCELLLTNLGNLHCDFDCGDLKLRALWGPTVFMGFEGEQTVGVNTTNGSLCLLHGSFAPLPGLLPRSENILRTVCEEFGSKTTEAVGFTESRL